jgi:hypothetical protein
MGCLKEVIIKVDGADIFCRVMGQNGLKVYEIWQESFLQNPIIFITS